MSKSPIEQLAELPDAERDLLIAGLSDREAAALLHDWRGFIARSDQIQPYGEWVHWLILSGRGWGKTKTGSETVREWAREKLPAPIHLISPTAADIRKVMIEGPSGILSCYPPGEAPLYEPSKGHLLTWPNGNIAYAFSAEEPERLRGPQCCRYWADELAAWQRINETWDNLMFGFRIGEGLKGVITTTPKPVHLLRELIKNPATIITRGSTYDNRRNLAPEFFREVIRKYEGTRIGRQELMGELLEDFPGALWTRPMIDSARIGPGDVHWDMIVRVVVAIDPAVSANENSDETGIITAALTRSEHILILDDDSCKESPLGWARRAVARYKMRKADRIVAEVNNGGDLVAANLYTVAPEVPFRAVRASRGKAIRAEPVAAMYEQGRVHHVGQFPTLEDQLCVARGSIITTLRGDIRIEKVRIGDMALTRAGWRRVTWAGCTGIRQTVEVTFSGGSISCTPDHPIFANGIFINASEVQSGDILNTCHTQSRTHPLNSKESVISETHEMATSRPAALAAVYCSIGQSGQHQMVQSPKDGTFTTSITTEGITDLKTSLRFPYRNTLQRTAARVAHGQPAKSSAVRSLGRCGQIGSRGLFTAKNAESEGMSRPCGKPDSALTIVESVIEKSSPEEVYNLSVDHLPEYYANGILVHNCEYVPGVTEKSPDRMDALVWAITELVVDPEVQELTLVRERDWYQISPI